MLVKLLVYAVLCSSTQGWLVQVTAECFNDVAVFWCTSEMGFLIWDVRTRIGSSKSFTFRSESHVGTTESHVLNSSQVIGNVTFNNGSFINATVTIVRPINLNGGMIDCNRDILTLNLRTDSSFTSVQLTVISIQQNIGIFNFMVTQSSDLPNTEEYLVAVSPPPPYGPDEITTASSALISLENSTLYNITIFVIACSERLNRTFVFGRCQFLVDSSSLSVLQYNINTSDVLSALVRCTAPSDNETYVIKCGMNGQWNTDITDNCSSSNQKTTIKNDINFMADTTSIVNSTVNTEEKEPPAQVSILALVIAVAASVIGTSVIALFIGIILGHLCKTTSKQNIPVPEENVMMKCPIYEEVKVEDKTINIDLSLSQNIAYEQVKKTES